MALLIVVFFSFDKISFIRGYWRNVRLTWHIRSIISCQGTITVIDTVTSSLLVISYRRLEAGSGCVCLCKGGHRRSRTSSWAFNGCKLQGRRTRVALCHVANVAYSTRCHVDDMEWPSGLWLSVNPTLDKQAVSAATTARGVYTAYTQHKDSEVKLLLVISN